MKFILTRGGKDGEWKNCRCSFHIGSDQKFWIIFDETTPEIGLNDGRFHSIAEIKGIANKICVNSNEGIYLDECFVEIDGKWHRDAFLLKFS